MPQSPTPLLALTLAWSGFLSGQQTPPVAPATATQQQPFQSRSGTFRLDLPADWRQLAPGEVAAAARAVPGLPHDLTENEPNLFYAIGAIDRWLQGTFDGTYLYVVEQDNEWVLDDQLQDRLRAMWQQKGARDGQTYAIEGVDKTVFGKDRYDAVVCRRTITPMAGRAQRSLDVHLPTGGRELTLCFVAWADEFDAKEPWFRSLLTTLALARRARGETSLGDRLWTPLVTGAVVGLILVILYRHTRNRGV